MHTGSRSTLQEQRRLFDVYSTKSTSTTSTDIKTREIDVDFSDPTFILLTDTKKR